MIMNFAAVKRTGGIRGVPSGSTILNNQTTAIPASPNCLVISLTFPVLLRLGPKYPVLSLSIRDEGGKPVAGTLTLARPDDPNHPFSVRVAPTARVLVPPVPFSFDIRAKGFRTWRSELISPRSDEIVSVTAQLKAKSPK